MHTKSWKGKTVRRAKKYLAFLLVFGMSVSTFPKVQAEETGQDNETTNPSAWYQTEEGQEAEGESVTEADFETEEDCNTGGDTTEKTGLQEAEETIPYEAQTTEDSMEDMQEADLTVYASGSHSYDSNGFCLDENCTDTYMPATQNTEGVYEISNAGQLYWFAKEVNSGNTAISGKLTQNIVINENVLTDGALNSSAVSDFRSWTPIGNYSNCFKGSFDGNNKSIRGIYTDGYSSYCGLFGYVSEGTIQNVSIQDSYIQGYYGVGGIVGCVIFSEDSGDFTIYNCHNEGQLVGKYTGVGGVVGYIYDNTSTGRTVRILGCTNEGAITGYNSVGGIVGYLNKRSVGKLIIEVCKNTASISGSTYVSGIAGYISLDLENQLDISNCVNSGDITAGNYDNGGIVGYIQSYKDSRITFSNCENTGNIAANGGWNGGILGYVGGPIGTDGGQVSFQQCSNSGTVTGTNYIGGIVGETYIRNVSFTDCENKGAQSGTSYVGGIVGGLNADYNTAVTIDTCSNSGAVNSTGNYAGGICAYSGSVPMDITSCSNTGSVTGTYAVGGIMGFLNGYNITAGSIRNCSNSGAITGTGYSAGGICGYSYHTSYDDCSNTGTIELTNGSYAGGIVGYNAAGSESSAVLQSCSNSGKINNTSDKGSSVYLGGIMGYGYPTVTVSNSYNEGAVTSQGTGNVSSNVGGIAGYVAVVTDCYNTAAITNTSYSGYTGGIVGVMSNETIQLGNSYNTAAVRGSYENIGMVGGLTGMISAARATLSQSYNTGSVSRQESGTNTSNPNYYNSAVGGVSGMISAQYTTIENCSNQGKVEGTGYVMGGLFGYGSATEFTVTDCENSKGISGEAATYMGGIGGYVSAQYVTFDSIRNSGAVNAQENSENVGGILGFGSAQELVLTENENSGAVSGGSTATAGLMAASSAQYITIESCSNQGAVSGTGKYLGGVMGNVANQYLVLSDTVNAGSVTGTAAYAGGIGASISSENAAINGCENKATIRVENGADEAFVGGLIGSATGLGTMTSSSNTGTVTGSYCTGGLMGVNAYTLSDCSNQGTVTGTYRVGGLIGTATGSMEKCYNEGTVILNAGDREETAAGGLIGEAHQPEQNEDAAQKEEASSLPTINNCYNTGAVQIGATTAYVGGLVGIVEAVMVKNSYSIGTLESTSKARAALQPGGIIGTLGSDADYENCYYSGSCGAETGIGDNLPDVEGKVEQFTDTDFARGLICYLLNSTENVAENDGTPVWYQNIDNGQPKDASPKFTGGIVYLHEGSTVTKDGTDVYSNYEKHVTGDQLLFTGTDEYEPYCIYTGVGHTECTICAQVVEENITAPALYDSHDYAAKIVKAATTEEEGLITYTCSRCGHSYDQVIEKLSKVEASEEKITETETTEAVKEADVKVPDTDSTEAATAEAKTNTSAETGDDVQPIMLMLLCIVSLLGGVFVSKKKTRYMK